MDGIGKTQLQVSGAPVTSSAYVFRQRRQVSVGAASAAEFDKFGVELGEFGAERDVGGSSVLPTDCLRRLRLARRRDSRLMTRPRGAFEVDIQGRAR